MFRHLGDLLTIKILKGRIKKEYCQDREILGFSENYLKLLQALYYCVANINYSNFLFHILQILWRMGRQNSPNFVFFFFSGRSPWRMRKISSKFQESLLEELARLRAQRVASAELWWWSARWIHPMEKRCFTPFGPWEKHDIDTIYDKSIWLNWKIHICKKKTTSIFESLCFFKKLTEINL